MQENIKTYKDVNNKSGINFRIQRMEEIYAERNGIADEPHRHDYYTVLLVKDASGKHFIDFNEVAMKPNQVFFVSPGQVHQVIDKKQSFGYVILFSEEFLSESHIPCYFIDDLELFNDYGYSPPLPLNEFETGQLSELCEEMLKIQNSDLKYREEAIVSYINLFLIHGNKLC